MLSGILSRQVANKLTVRLPREDVEVVPIETYRRLVECAEDAEDIQAFDRAMAEVANGEDEVVPEAVAHRLFSGEEHPVRVWREYRGLTQEDLAQVAGVGKSYISQLEAGRKTGSLRLMRDLAQALEVDMEDLISPEREAGSR